jgi:hypothetical protein
MPAEDPVKIVYYCYNDDCLFEGMIRYQAGFNKYPTYINYENIIIDRFYIQVNHRLNKTVISRLKSCFLFDSIEIPKAIKIDFKNTSDIINKAKILMLFS